MNCRSADRPLGRALGRAMLLVMVTSASCSHTQPYFRSDIPNPLATFQADREIRSRLVLVGDAGETDAATLDTVGDWASEESRNTIVVFLGDNMYPEGMTPRYRSEADARLLPQIEAATGEGARALFVPGNHDWADGSEAGYEAVVEQGRYVTERLGYGNGFLPANGCPGPVAVDLLEGLRIVAVDTQWWLHRGDKPTEHCLHSTRESVIEAFGELLETDRHVVVAAHHPLFGYGRHAGFSDWKDHLLLPVVGSVIALSRKFPLRDQDYNSSPYRAMVDAFTSAMDIEESRNSLVIWAAGHEHNLQVLEAETLDYVLVSGSGAKTNPVTHGDETLFAHSQAGFMVFDLMQSGSVFLRVVEPESGEVFTRWLLDGGLD